MSKQKTNQNKQKKLNQKDALKLKKAKRAKQKKIFLIVGIVVLLLAISLTIILVVNKCKKDKENSLVYCAVVSFGDYGTVTIALDSTNAPKTVARFESLAKQGYYNGLSFTDIADGCIYGGSSDKEDELSSIYGEFKHNNTGSFLNELSFTKGVIAMNRSSEPNSAKAEFFITLKDMSTELDGKYAAFGTVKEGMDVIEKMVGEAQDNESYEFPKITGITFEKK